MPYINMAKLFSILKNSRQHLELFVAGTFRIFVCTKLSGFLALQHSNYRTHNSVYLSITGTKTKFLILWASLMKKSSAKLSEGPEWLNLQHKKLFFSQNLAQQQKIFYYFPTVCLVWAISEDRKKSALTIITDRVCKIKPKS